ncbi:MAG: hypothetical protein AAF235_05460 [Planctomycetota bacterium]
MGDERERAISRNSRVTLGLALAIIAVLIWNERRMSSIESKLEQLAAGTVDRWTAAQQEAWALRLAVTNPDLVVPDPANPGMTIHTRKLAGNGGSRGGGG